ncbi:MAG: hypothetical protein J5965_16735 [Aeriscardovia sp.]|nr:hypothetical protein [Aeriscardovia sp.]
MGDVCCVSLGWSEWVVWCSSFFVDVFLFSGVYGDGDRRVIINIVTARGDESLVDYTLFKSCGNDGSESCEFAEYGDFFFS